MVGGGKFGSIGLARKAEDCGDGDAILRVKMHDLGIATELDFGFGFALKSNFLENS